MQKLPIIGTTSWGITLAMLMCNKGLDVGSGRGHSGKPQKSRKKDPTGSRM